MLYLHGKRFNEFKTILKTYSIDFEEIDGTVVLKGDKNVKSILLQFFNKNKFPLNFNGFHIIFN